MRVLTAEQRAVILARACPACYAKPGYPCTRPTDNGRAPVAWFHYAREVPEE